MKRPVAATGSSRGWLGPSIVAVSGFVTCSSAGHHQEDFAYRLPGAEEGDNLENWESALMLPAPPGHAIAEDQAWLTPKRSDPGELEAGVGNVARMSPAGANSRQGSHAFAKELAVLKAEVAQMNQARAIEQRELSELRERLQALERKFDDLLAIQDFDVEEAPIDPHALWIQQNFDELRKYPDMFVALDPERGILIHATEQTEFAAKLETLSPEENERVSLFHTSMYLRG